MTKALSDSKVSPWTVLCMAAMNIVFGPFQMLDTSEELLVVTSADCAVLRAVWPRICDARGWLLPTETCREARQRFATTLPGERTFNKEGDKCAMSTWLSILLGFRNMQGDSHTRAFGLCMLCVLKEWSKSAEDILHTSSAARFGGTNTKGARKPKAADVLTDVTCGSGAASSSGAALAAKTPAASGSTATMKASGKDEVGLLHRKSEDSLHAAARVMADPNVYEYMVLISTFAKPELKAHLENTRMFGDSQSMRAWYSKQASGVSTDNLYDILAQLDNLSELGRAGFIVNFSGDMKNALRENTVVVGGPGRVGNASLCVVHLHRQRAPLLVAGSRVVLS